MNVMGFNVDSCAGLPPGSMMACAWGDDGKLHVAVRTPAGGLKEGSFTPQQFSEMVERATVEYWDKLRVTMV